MKERNYIYISDDLRVYRSDDKNVILERHSKKFSIRDQEEVESWGIVGYFRNIHGALEKIIKNDMLLDEDKINNLDEYVQEIRTVRENIMDLVYNIEGDKI